MAVLPTFVPVNLFSSLVMAWFAENRRDLPWRRTRDPYLIWISEIILQQTRVQQGLPYYERFIRRFPTLSSMDGVAIEDLFTVWQGLGYYSRARNLLATAEVILAHQGGRFPNSFAELIKLKGIGHYTAAAIASFAFGEKVPTVDGNVFRLLARYFGNDTPVDTNAGKRTFTELAATLISEDDPGWFNQAVMEFGSLVCSPKPRCADCILSAGCVAFATGTQRNLPVKRKAARPVSRYFNYLLPPEQGEIYLVQRRSPDIWQGLFEFPQFESQNELTEASFSSHPALLTITEGRFVRHLSVIRPSKHILSHQLIYPSFWRLDAQSEFLFRSAIKVPAGGIAQYAVPRIISRFLET